MAGQELSQGRRTEDGTQRSGLVRLGQGQHLVFPRSGVKYLQVGASGGEGELINFIRNVVNNCVFIFFLNKFLGLCNVIGVRENVLKTPLGQILRYSRPA